MSSIKDWAARAAARIVMEDFVKVRGQEACDAAESRIAAIIATFAEPLVVALRESRLEHHHCEDDSWYCCGACTHECEAVEEDPGHEHSEGCCVDSHDNPKRVQGVCDCGADAWNARVGAALAGEKPASP